MAKSLLDDPFRHHVWATLRLLDACADLDEEQLASEAPGIYGSIIDTLNHLVGADCSYLAVLSKGRAPSRYQPGLGVSELRSLMQHNGEAWAEVLTEDLNPDEVLVRHRSDGSESHAPTGVRLAQVIHHGTDHRSQVCTVLSTIGIDPPAIDVWDFAGEDGRLFETPPTN